MIWLVRRSNEIMHQTSVNFNCFSLGGSDITRHHIIRDVNLFFSSAMIVFFFLFYFTAVIENKVSNLTRKLKKGEFENQNRRKHNFVENMIFKFHWFINMCYNQEGKK